jgi:DNA-binding transcriptional LysR family regulator
MGESKLKISQLQALVAVADRGSFSLAALDLELSQSTISHAIATLEGSTRFGAAGAWSARR